MFLMLLIIKLLCLLTFELRLNNVKSKLVKLTDDLWFQKI